MRPIAIALFLAALAVVSILPEPLKGLTSTRGLLHDALHIAAFLAAFLISAGPIKNPSRIAFWAVLLMCFGAVLELLQTQVYHNLLEVRDILDDAIGIGIGRWIIGAVHSRRFPIIEK